MVKLVDHKTTVSHRYIQLSLAVLYSICHSLVFIGPSVAQKSIRLPSSERPRQIELLPAQSPTPLFQQRPTTPSGYSPPVYEPQKSQQFQLYRLDTGDGISVKVPGFPEFDFTGSVDPEGNVQVPILGRIPVVGLTLDELETKISYELYKRFLKTEPVVNAVLDSPRPVQLTVLGEVIKPGYYSLAPNTPLTAVLLAAGGSTSNADLRSVIVRRTLIDGTVLEQQVDLYTPLIEGLGLPDVRLQGGDTVIISRLSIGQEKGYDRQLISRTTLTQPTITVRLLVPIEPSGVAFRNITLPNGSTFLDIVASFPVTDSLRVRSNEVSLLRFDPDKGGIITQTLNPRKAVRGDIAQNIPLRDQDVIIVSRTLLGKVFAGFRVLTQPIRDVFGFTTSIFDITNQLGGSNNNR
ncbi:polysaccharide biosynthesis/export family protein [Gloeothece verrucosa]|uniref:Polysaccharide export protein n=1 Tax=Gloeothece verrucosa (strain PCC 7822) TaxID=497965 RepID=E0UI72_GLOV7|nr:polysaccharide biosynthesis/export family protein [Gloeothece verrucosa]ADN15724.1 polysaccharide export protein [Gloeothece verrucosa PCC 7822]